VGVLGGRDLFTLLDFEPALLREVIDRALAIKAGRDRPDLRGRVATLLFFNPSVRTRLSCESAFGRFGGTPVTVQPGKDTWTFELEDGAVMDTGTQEHVRELGPVLARMCDVIGVRKSELIAAGSARGEGSGGYAELARDDFMRRLAEHADVPVVNLESNRYHPMQGLADAATLVEKLGDPRGRKYILTWAWHPKPLPVATPHSQLVAACDLGMDVTLLRPPGYDLDPEVTAAARARAEALGGSLTETDDQAAAYEGAEVVCAKSWSRLDAYGRFDEELAERRGLRADWIVDAEKMARTREAWFMHCLPVRRNVIVADAVIDSARSAVVDEAENRLWTAAAVFAEL
jgi:N-acetylornithine carbamoyltransferase